MEILDGSAFAPEQLVDFADFVFSKSERPHDFATLLPKMYGAGRVPLDHHVVAVEDGQILGMALYNPFTLMAGDTALKGVGVGTVSVHPRAQGKGVMKAVMNALLDTRAAKEADFLILGGQRQRYEYYGFTPMCRRYCHEVGTDNVRHALRDTPENIKIVPFTDEYVAPALALHDTQPSHVQRSAADFIITLRSWNATPYVFLKKGKFSGYCSVCGGHVGEFVMENYEDILPAVKALSRHVNGHLQFVCSPLHPANHALASIAESTSSDDAHSCRIQHLDKVTQAMFDMYRSLGGLPEGQFGLPIAGEGMLFIKNSHSEGAQVKFQVLNTGAGISRMEAARRLFSNSAQLMSFAAPGGWFPLPLFVGEPDLV